VILSRSGVEVRAMRRYSLVMTTRRVCAVCGLGIVLLLASLLLPPTALANGELIEDATDLAFDRKPTVGDATYEFLGTGIRKVFLFKIYAIAFCIEASRVAQTVEEDIAGRAGF
jgi:hypothetical protein